VVVRFEPTAWSGAGPPFAPSLELNGAPAVTLDAAPPGTASTLQATVSIPSAGTHRLALRWPPQEALIELRAVAVVPQ
jgi:hypothetical protein